VTDFVIPFIEPEAGLILETRSDKDAKSLFQELAQSWSKITPTYQSIAEVGPDHAKEFTIGAYLGDICYGQGIGPNKQQAAQAAARAALINLEAEILRRSDEAPLQSRDQIDAQV
jgi:ribonuclease-3